MKRFEFRLEKVLSWRRLQQEMEEAKLERLRAAKARLLEERRQLNQELQNVSQQVLSCSTLTAQELLFLDGFREFARQREQQLEQRTAEVDREIQKQAVAVREVRRACRLLEKLRERKLQEWQEELDREQEHEAGENFLIKWAREAALNKRRAALPLPEL